jgi:5-(carboxyamino)imidazole ribonucleotide synthase
VDEKTTCRALGIATAAFAAVDSPDALPAAVDAVGGVPVVVKTRRGGYDGKGQRVLHDAREVEGVWADLGGVALVVEVWVPFDRELSVLAVRDPGGAVTCWPVVENRHEDGILRVTRAPAPRLDPAVQVRAETIAQKLATDLDHVGVLAVELFDVGGDLLVNELAPRVHNSGHWTIEGAETSQFENHVRAVLGLPLGSTAARGASVMYNCIGTMPSREAILAVPGAHYHSYGKAPRVGRKLGHVTLTAADEDDLTKSAHMVRALLA